ncbi:MAG: hypothetical protein IJ176_06640 [Prevotella sp.]|nr:hypothetical protein [Prevotella sp.]
MFSGVTVKSSTAGKRETDCVDFVGILSPTSIYHGGDRTTLYLGDNNKLYYPETDFNINAFRAYFQLKGGLTAGDPASDSNVRAFNLNFASDESLQGVSAPSSDRGEAVDEAFYSLEGLRLQGKPSQKGIYLHNGKKVLVK